MTTPPITRRSTLKAGAHAAWMVPTVQIVAATPAFAASLGDVNLVLSNASASYGSDGGGVRPDRLLTAVEVVNTGADPAQDVLVSLQIPGDLYAVAPTSFNPPSGWVAAPATGDLASGWTISWQRSAPLGQNQPETPTFSVQFNDPLTESPYRTWAGEAFTVGVLATATNGSPESADSPPSVAATDPTTFTVNEFGGYYQGPVLILTGVVQNFGRKSTGNVTLEVWWEPDPDDDSAWSIPPSSSGSTSPGLTGGQLTGTGAIGDPYTYTVVHGPTAPYDSYAGGPSTDEEADSTLIPFRITVDLGAAPDPEVEADGPRMVYLRATAAEAVPPPPEPEDYSGLALAVNGPVPSGS